MKTIFLTLIILCNALLAKDYYNPRPYFYYENGVFVTEYPEAKFYTMDQINDEKVGNHIRNKMGLCITEFELHGVEMYGCNETFNTLQYYITKPKGLLRKDILEYYHDMPLEEYEKMIPKNVNSKYKNEYSNYMNQQFNYHLKEDLFENLRKETK